MSATTKWICACFLLISFRHSSAQSLAELAKMAGIDLKEIGAEHFASDPSSSSSFSSTSSPIKYPFRPPPIAGMMGNMNTPFGGFSSPFPTFPGFEGNNFGFGLNDGLAATSTNTNETAKNGTTTKKPSCGGCGKPGCPECAGKLGIGMTPPSEFGGFPMASGMESEGGFGGFESFQGAVGVDGGFGAMSSAFQPSMNGFGGPFGGYGASSASFMNPATFVPFAAAHSILSSHGLTDGSPIGYEGYGGEISQINPGFNMPFSPEPYPMRGGRGGRSRGRPSREPEQDYKDQPPQHHYDGPSQEQGYDGPSQDAPDERYHNDQHAPSHSRPHEYDHHQPQYQREPQSEQDDRHHGPPSPPPAGRYEYDQ